MKDFDATTPSAAQPDIAAWQEEIVLLLATVLNLLAIYRVPQWQGDLADPCHVASILAIVTILALHVTARSGPLGIKFERILLALFLAGMPIVYVASWFAVEHEHASHWLLVELGGLPIYITLAVLGLTRSPWLLAAGITAHGLAWDTWHIAGSDYIPSWYAIGCLMADIGIGAYVAVRIPAWNRCRAK